MRPARLLRSIVFGRKHDWGIGIAAGIVALVALIAGTVFGHVSQGASLREILVALGCSFGILVFGVIATARISEAAASSVFVHSTPSAGVAVRIFTSGVGYLICAFSLLAVLDVSVGKLLIGAGLAGVIIGIAAQPSLGNLFAGIVLVAARPFRIGDHIRIRSGALGGIFDAWVLDLSLAYVTLRTDDGILRVPNASMLAAGVLQLTPDSSPLPAPAVPPPAVPPPTPLPEPE
jgi:small-conductance mechanosensitive channel